MTTLLQHLQGYLGLALFLVILLLVLVLWIILRLAKGSRARPEAERFGRASEVAEEAIDLTVPPPRADLRRSFARARSALRHAFPGRGVSYRRPWVLVLGPPLAGKTTLLGKSGLGMPFGQPRQAPSPDHPGLNWWAMEGGVALDVAGEDLLRLDGVSSDAVEWKSILRRIRRIRPRRPLDGIVLTLPAEAFLDEKKPLAQRLAEASRRGALLHRKLAEAQRTLGMRLPVYLLISHCDRIPGFSDLLLAGLGSAAQRQQMFGWSNPESPNAPYSAAWIDRAFDRLLGEVGGFQLQSLAKGSGSPAALDAVLFPTRLARLREPLRIYATHLFSPSAAGEPAIFRGVYLCGGGGDGAASGAAGSIQLEMPSEVAFVADLLNRKVFPEAGIARPTDSSVARARLRRGALAGLAVAALLWTGWGIWRGAPGVRAAAGEVEPFLGTVATGLDAVAQGAGTAAGASSPLPGTETGALLAAGSRVRAFGLRSPALPASWLSGLPGRVQNATEEGFQHLAFDPARGVLERRTRELLEWRPPEPPASRAVATIYAIEGYPEFQALDRLTHDLDRLGRSIGSYQRFALEGSLRPADALEEFNSLAVATLGDRLRPQGRGPERYFGRRLAGIGATPFDYHHGDSARRLETKVVAQARSLFDALFDANPLSADLDAVLVNWVPGGAGRRPRPSEVERYRDLLAALRRTRRDIEVPELQWTAADGLNLGSRFDEILRRVHVSPFLGPAVADQLKREAVAGFARLQEELAVYSTSDTGVLLLREEQKWALSPRLVAVLDGLTALFGQPFMQRRCSPLPMDRSPEGRDLFWKSKPLEDALALYAAYAGWDGSSELPAPLRDAGPEVAAEAVAANVSCMIAEAQTFEYPPATDDASVVENSIKLQVQNLQASEKTLQDLLNALGRLELRSEQADLAQILRYQRVHILGQLGNLLASLDLYAPLGGGFGWWQGGPAPALAAFGAASQDELAGYLDTQREIVGRLATEYAQPVLAMFGASGQIALLQPVPPASKWQRVTADLGAYDSQQAGNPLARLEELINAIALEEPPEAFDLYACFGDALPPASAPGGDFFLARRQALRGALVERCAQLADEIGYEKYVALAAIFNQRLWGKFPFASPSATDDATPDEIRELFDADFGRALVLIENLPAESARFGDKRESVQQFMRRMDDARRFFASFLAPEAKTPNPIYDLQVRFRIERTREQGANQIISWLMSVGEPAAEGEKNLDGDKIIDLLGTGSVSPAPDEKKPLEADARWLYGRPVSLRFRWATGSPYAPYAPSGASKPRVTVDGRTLLYRYREPWSLLRLLTENLAPTDEFPDLADPQPETVKLSIDTVSEDRPEPRTVADIYLQITLLSPDENKVLELPEFPTLEAPLTEPLAPRSAAPVDDRAEDESAPDSDEAAEATGADDEVESQSESP